CVADASVVRAKVISAIPLSDEQLQKMAENFAKRLKVSKVILDSEVDNSIIGGAIIKTDGLIYDGSIQTQINQIRQRLVG
ncbi:ATP synthase F1 subunit delta, partial [Pediococcus acidilactici]|nr:ATP synthase F1 subunit delta [Pediococcus acidilactici]